MIQRIQSIYLFIVFILNICLFFSPLAYFKSYGFYIYGVREITENIVKSNYLNYLPLIILTTIIALLAIITLFLYKNRQLQIKLVRLNIMLDTILVAVIFFYYTERIAMELLAKTTYTIFSVIPIVSLILLILCMGAIYKDERLVRSADRLR